MIRSIHRRLMSVMVVLAAGAALAPQAARGAPAARESRVSQPDSGGATPAGGGKTSPKDLAQAAKDSGKHVKLCEAIKSAGFEATLREKGSFTFFAPTDDAIRKLPAGTWESWMKPENKPELQRVLKYHVIKGVAMKVDDFKSIAETRPTLHGGKLKIAVKGGRVWLNGKASIVKSEPPCTNGELHVIDAVLLPPPEKQQPEKKDQGEKPGKDADKPGAPKGR
ncbi:MAG: fasciclin domain-containing protein [Phycisphaerales bacterium]